MFCLIREAGVEVRKDAAIIKGSLTRMVHDARQVGCPSANNTLETAAILCDAYSMRVSLILGSLGKSNMQAS